MAEYERSEDQTGADLGLSSVNTPRAAQMRSRALTRPCAALGFVMEVGGSQMLGMMTAVRIGTSVLSAISLGLWVNVYTDQLSHAGYLSSLTSLQWSNIPLVLGVGSLIVGERAARRWQMLEHDDFKRRYEMLQRRQRRVLENILGIVCDLISRTLQVSCNARYFIAEKDQGGRYYIRQDRDLAVLNISMPREYGFTRIYVDTPHIVSGQAFRDRVPLYSELPVNHTDWYETDVGRMIEPRQRWILACPVLRLDAVSNSHDECEPPHGVIVFYGTEVPGESDSPAHIHTALDYSQRFAEQMSHVFNMLELSTDLEMASARNDSGTS